MGGLFIPSLPVGEDHEAGDGKAGRESEEGDETDLGALLWGRGRGKASRGS